jgi:hypothetical protein
MERIRFRPKGVMACALMGAALMPVSVQAGSKSRSVTLSVSATIPKHASVSVLSQPTTVEITRADLARGFVDVSGTALAIRCNSRSGYMLTFDTRGDFVRQTQVQGIGNDVQIGSGGGVIARPAEGRGMGKATLALNYHFVLSDSAQAGTYGWPIQVSVTPL